MVTQTRTVLNRLFLRLQSFIRRLTEDDSADPYRAMRLAYPGVMLAGIENMAIGERVSIAAGAFLSADSPITVGHDTMIASGAIINTATHDYNNHPMWKERISRPIEIGCHVWIGSGAIILPGVRVGNYAVIGAGAVVTRHVPEKAIVVGSPARVVKYRELQIYDPDSECTPVGVRLGFLKPEHLTTEP